MRLRSTRTTFILAAISLLACGMAVLFHPESAASEATTKPPAVRIGMIQTLFRGVEANTMLALTEPFSELLYSQTGIRGQFCIVADGKEMARQIQGGELHLGILHGIEFAWIKQQYSDLKPLILAYNHTIKLKGYLLVRDDSDVQQVAQLKGKPAAFPKRSLNHCYVFTHMAIQEAGHDPAGFFGASSCPANTEAALDAVVDGTAVATVVDGVALETYKSRKPGRAARLRVIKESCIYPTATFIYKPDAADPDMVKKFQEGMTTAHTRILGRQMLTLWRLSNFGQVPDEYAELLNDILKIHPQPMTPAAFIVEPQDLAGKMK
jgi:phosphonate transport system substrate-binding protein